MSENVELTAKRIIPGVPPSKPAEPTFQKPPELAMAHEASPQGTAGPAEPLSTSDPLEELKARESAIAVHLPYLDTTERRAFIGEQLVTIQEGKLYVAAGFKSFEAYLATRQKKICRSRAYQLIGFARQRRRSTEANLPIPANERQARAVKCRPAAPDPFVELWKPIFKYLRKKFNDCPPSERERFTELLELTVSCLRFRQEGKLERTRTGQPEPMNGNKLKHEHSQVVPPLGTTKRPEAPGQSVVGTKDHPPVDCALTTGPEILSTTVDAPGARPLQRHEHDRQPRRNAHADLVERAMNFLVRIFERLRRTERGQFIAYVRSLLRDMEQGLTEKKPKQAQPGTCRV